MRRRDGRAPLRRSEFGYRFGERPPEPPATHRRAAGPPPSEAEVRGAVLSALQARGPATFADLLSAVPVEEAPLARALASLAVRGQIIEAGDGWSAKRSWRLAGPSV